MHFQSEIETGEIMAGPGTTVHITDIDKGLSEAIRGCFDAFGGAAALLKRSGDVYLPLDTRIEVSVGDKVKAGTSILGFLQ